jgi:Domain of unknown function (DUF4265)
MEPEVPEAEPEDDPNYKRIFVPMEQDENGYPPYTVETLWAFKTGDLHTIDNIPIFAKGISLGDIVDTEIGTDGELVFDRVVTPSQNSVFRVSVADESDRESARRAFGDLGCASEGSHIARLFAFIIPGDKPIEPVIELIDHGLASGRWDIEEGVLRHKLP